MKSRAPFLILAGFALAGCGRGEAQNTDGQAAQKASADKPQAVEVVTLKTAVMASTVALPGQLLPYESVDLFPRVAGFVQDIPVDRGSQVKKGQVLVRLNAPELAAQREQAAGVVRAAEAKAAADRATYERLANAAKTPGVVAENDVNIARQTAEADDAQVASARESLKNVAQQEAYLRITAPFDGVVTARNLHPGALVGPASGPGAQPILQMANVKRLRLVIPVPETDVQGVKPGQMATFTVASTPGRKFQAPIARIAEAFDNKTRTMAVELDVANAGGALTAGEYATVQWPVRRSYPTLQAPQTAVANDQQRQFVIRVQNGVTQWVDVTTGISADGKVEVFGQLKPGDQIVRRGSDALQPGTKVEAKAAS
jgi:RND family efflux transporter MFP subunit